METGDRRIAMDPKFPVNADYVFISHAHFDHLPSTSWDANFIATRETAELAEVRGLRIGRLIEDPRDMTLVPTGHILGSAGLLVDGEIFYTGDIAGRPRAFLREAERVECRTLIIESTYGRPGYVFPSITELMEEVEGSIAAAYNAGRPAILMGYPLGKAQVLEYIARAWRPLISFRGVERYSDVYRGFGVDLPEPDVVVSKIEELLDLGRPALVIAPSTVRSRAVAIAERIGGIAIWFSGWALHWRGNYMGIPLSDHADHEELIEYSLASSAGTVLTTHGYAGDLARSLRSRGLDARPLSVNTMGIREDH